MSSPSPRKFRGGYSNLKRSKSAPRPRNLVVLGSGCDVTPPGLISGRNERRPPPGFFTTAWQQAQNQRIEAIRPPQSSSADCVTIGRQSLGSVVGGGRSYKDILFNGIGFPSLVTQNVGQADGLRNVGQGDSWRNVARGDRLHQNQNGPPGLMDIRTPFPVMSGRSGINVAENLSAAQGGSWREREPRNVETINFTGLQQVESSNPIQHYTHTYTSLYDDIWPELNMGSFAPEREIRTFPCGRITNIPESMIADQFGVAGLLANIRMYDREPTLGGLTLGLDLRSLEMDLNSPVPTLPNFTGPFGGGIVGAENVDHPVPPSYEFTELQNRGCLFALLKKEQLEPMDIKNFNDDLLFYLFYQFTQDVLQTLAAHELYMRKWRYHMEARIWLSSIPGKYEAGENCTRGKFFYFDSDPSVFRKKIAYLIVEHDKLEKQPNIPI